MRKLLRAALVAGALACGSGLAGEMPVAQAYASVDKSDFVGVYRLVDATKNRAAIRAIIDTATEDMPVFRGIARERLYETTEPLSVVVITFPADNISVGYLGERAVVSADGGEPVKWRNRLGDKAVVSQRFGGSTIVQQYKGAMGGKRKSVYRLSADHRTLTIHTTVTADLMPHPVVYATTWARK